MLRADGMFGSSDATVRAVSFLLCLLLGMTRADADRHLYFADNLRTSSSFKDSSV